MAGSLCTKLLLCIALAAAGCSAGSSSDGGGGNAGSSHPPSRSGAPSGGREAPGPGGADNVSAGTGGTMSPGLPAGGSGGSAGDLPGPTAGAGGAGTGRRPTVEAVPGTTLVRVDSGQRYQTFEGWGTSLCWWANHVGSWAAPARDALVEAIVNPESGLGYNVFRYNIGGGDAPSHSHMGEHRDMPGFRSAAGTWDFGADAAQRAILQRIVASQSDAILEAFSNSPPYWMTKSGCASGSSDGSNNLKEDYYDDFADYLTEVVKYYHDELGITFRTLEPLNEPNANWWKSNGSQEGCHFSPSNQEAIIREVAAQLSAKGLTGTSVSASDENSMDDAYANLRAFDAATLAAISQLNTHSYAGSRRKELSSLASSKNKRLWQSESGPLNQSLADDAAAALFMAGRIITDLRDLKPNAWVDWQVGDPARAWATFTLNDGAQTFAPLKRFYMHAAFSRFIRPGAVFVDVDNAEMVAALAADAHSLALVIRNGDTSATRRFTFDLTRLPAVGASAAAHRTSRTEDLAAVPDVAIEGYAMVVTAPPYSVTTLVVPIP